MITHRELRIKGQHVGLLMVSVRNTRRCTRKARRIIKDSSHPSHRLLSLLPSGRRLRSIRSRTSRLRDSFFPQAIRLMNSQNDPPYNTLPLTQHAMHCTLTQFYRTTHTHCTNTTYLLSLDTIQKYIHDTAYE